jgi:hypothetical protein
MTLKIVTADQRATEAVGVKALIVGPSGVGKTSLLRTLPDISKVLFLDVESGDLSVSDVPVDAIRPHTWPEMRDIACWLGGPNRAFPATAPYSEAHYQHVCETLGPPTVLDKYDTLFVDSLSVASRICLNWAQTQSEAFNKQGQPDPRGAYGLLGREFIAWATQLQSARSKNVILLAILDHVKDDFGRMTWEIQIAGAASGRQLPGIFDQVVTMAPVDFGDGTPVRAFVTKFNNEYGFPAKDRSGRLEEIEEPNLGKLIAKAADQERRREAFGTSLPPRTDATQQAA